MTDDLVKQLRSLAANLPEPSGVFSEDQKDDFILLHGFGLVRDIFKAKKELPIKRIPHLFSSVDSQVVVDVLANEWRDALLRRKKKLKDTQ